MQLHICPGQSCMPLLPLAHSSEICRKALLCRRQSLPLRHQCRRLPVQPAASQHASSTAHGADEDPHRRPHFAQQILRVSAGLFLLLAGTAGLTRPAFAANRYNLAHKALVKYAAWPVGLVLSRSHQVARQYYSCLCKACLSEVSDSSQAWPCSVRPECNWGMQAARSHKQSSSHCKHQCSGRADRRGALRGGLCACLKSLASQPASAAQAVQEKEDPAGRSQ